MDSVFITKVVTHLAYPASLIGICLIFSLLFLFFGKNIKSGLAILVGSGIYLLTSNPIISSNLVSNLEFKHPQISLENTPKADAIIVLGGSIRPPAFPRKYSQLTSSSDRFWHAARLFKANKADKIILLGGNVFESEDIKPEALYVKTSLERLGIPEDSIIIETQSKTTQENETYSQAILEKYKVKSALLVTSALHMPRAMREFENSSAKMIPSSSDNIVALSNQPSIFNWIPNANAFSNSTKALHEYYGLFAIQGSDKIDAFKAYLARPAQQTAAL